MKDKILKIILEKWKTSPTAATEIADMVKAFVGWKDENCATIFIRDGKVGRWYAYNGKYYSYNELFNYWYTNIKSTDK